MILLLAAMAVAQGTLRVMHVWVDPHYGNDAGAVATLWPANPRPGNIHACNPATENTVPDVVNTAQAPLLHAPWPFKTISAAVAYIPLLPHTSPTTGVTWEFAIVHLMPGTYIRSTSPDQHNQVVGNGESFPITVPDRVSIQGTSALNTIIDVGQAAGQGPGGPAFRFLGTAPNPPVPGSSGSFSYISHLSITGGRPTAPQGQPWLLSAIYCAPGPVPCTPTIVNCFLFGNGVGVLIDSSPSAPHQVTLINNTIAWNVIGVWNGQAPPFPGPSVGIAKLMLLNNIFDATPAPLPGEPGICSNKSFPRTWGNWIAQSAGVGGPSSPFEGVDATDVGVVPGPVDYNAYEGLIYNNGVAYPTMGLPATTPRSSSPVAPGIDISPYTGRGGGLNRGVLYVRDLLHNGPPFHVGGNGTLTCDFDLSPGDFRLAPAVALAHAGTTPNVPSALSPLVDAGISAPFPITMANGMVLAAPPQTLLGNGTWPHDLWATDCEGHGNPRIVDYPVIPLGQDPYPRIDIGADELDLLIVAGSRFGTTMFSWLLGMPGVQKDNHYLWMLGPPTTLTAPITANSYRPQYATLWRTPDPANPTIPFLPWLFGPPSAYYTPRVVDIMPHLLPDAHPYHAITTHPHWPTNPIWQDCGALQAIHNAWLYIDPISPIVNPPGSAAPPFNAPGFNWLDGASLSQQTWGPFNGPLNAPPQVATFGAWCQNTTGSGQDWDDVQTTLQFFLLGPGTGGAARVTLEFQNIGGSPSGTPYAAAAGSNIQSFMLYQQQ